jgi:drug/metabolite transporter (DMT)-like permease
VITVFALAAAVLYGGADFLGGAASRRAHTLAVLTVSAPAGAVVMLAAALVTGGPASTAGLGWAVAGGTAGGAGLIVFYEGLATGPMSVVAPVSALVSTLLPVGVALATGERPGLGVGIGAVVCLAAIVLISLERSQPGTRMGRPAATRALLYGIGSGAAFGLFFLFLRNAGSTGVFWPVTASRLAGSAVMLVAAAWLGVRPGWRGLRRRVFLAAIASGIIDAVANVCYVLSTRAGMFGMAVVLTSLYPGITVLLARLVLGERMRPVQRVGLALAAAGVVLVTV